MLRRLHGEELQVIWELEPGTTVHEKSTLPNPDLFDGPKRLQAFIDAVRWGAISQADDKALQSPFRSGIEVEDYQLDPVVRALIHATGQPSNCRRCRPG